MTISIKKAFVAIAICSTTALGAQALDIQDFVLSQSRPHTIGEVNPALDGGSYYQLSPDGQKIEKCSFKTDATTGTVFDAATARGAKLDQVDGYKMSADESKILLWTNVEPIYRHSFKADYYVYDVRHNKLTKLSEAGGEEIATMSPDGRMWNPCRPSGRGRRRRRGYRGRKQWQ